MTEDQRIDTLNKIIITNQKKLKKMDIIEDGIGLSITSGIIIVSGIFLIKNYDNHIIREMTPIILCSSIITGCIPGICLPTRKSMMKKGQYKKEIINSLNELHGYALEEEKKLMNKK